MGRIKIATCMLVALAGAVAIVVDRDKRDAATAPRDGRLLLAGFAEPEPIAESPPSRAALRGCASRISGGPRRLDGDTIVGPLRFNMETYDHLREWRWLVRNDQWAKSVARVRAGEQVTLVVPPEQHSWMRLRYARHDVGVAAVTLRACRHRRPRAARRKECVWAEGLVGPPGSIRPDYTACRSGPTFFSGGFDIDYAEAPQQGRCAALIVWVKGEEEPHRVPLLRTEPGECDGDPA